MKNEKLSIDCLTRMQRALSDLQSNTDGAEQVLQPGMRQCADRESERYADSVRAAQRENSYLYSLRDREVDAAVLVEEGRKANMQPQVQRRSQGSGMEDARAQGEATLETGVGVCVQDSDNWIDQSGVEGRSDISESQRSLLRSSDQVPPLSDSVPEHGTEGWLCDGTSPNCCASNQQAAPANGSGSSSEPQSHRERNIQPDAVREQCGPQGIRAWRGHKTAVVRVVPFQYAGKMWCLRVPTGAFVAVRDGVAFPTGNSGFPKSLDVSKAIDKAAGAERPVIGINKNGSGPNLTKLANHSKGDTGIGYMDGSGKVFEVTSPATDAAHQWSGWGTALKPAHEPIVVARKPLVGTVAANVLEHGTGALNIDGCRVEHVTVAGGNPSLNPHLRTHINGGNGGNIFAHEDKRRVVVPNQSGRWPSNLIHDGSPEVLQCFPDSKGQQGDVRGDEPSGVTNEIYGKFNSRVPAPARNDSGPVARFFLACSLEDSEWLCQKLAIIYLTDYAICSSLRMLWNK